MLTSRFALVLLALSPALIGLAAAAGKGPQVLAHRGASGSAPETTLASYRLALRMKVDFLELDVQMTRDGELVAIHDTTVDRTSDGKGAVGQMTLAELRKLDAGSWFNRTRPERARPEYAGERIPLLQEIIDLARPAAAGLYIETKSPELYPEEFEAKLLEVIKRNRFGSRVVVQSFSARSVEKVRALDKSIRTALLVEDLKKDPVEATLAAGAPELAIRYTLLTPEIAKRARDKGLGLTVWTANDEASMKRMIELGVDRIITDFPERLNSLLGR